MKPLFAILLLALPAPAAEFPFAVHVDPALRLPGLTPPQIRRVLDDAFHQWNLCCGAAFQPGKPGMLALTVNSGHLGRERSSAWNGFPTLGGTITFDSGESWTEAKLKHLALHEIGHFLGRNCVDNGEQPPAGSVMNHVGTFERLSADDRRRAVEAFGPHEPVREARR